MQQLSTDNKHSRYRGGEIGGLAADKLREINRAHEVYTATESKRQKVKAALTKAGHRIDGRLEAALASARTVAEVEEVYGPYKPDAKRTKAAAARALGLGPAADAVGVAPSCMPSCMSIGFVTLVSLSPCLVVAPTVSQQSFPPVPGHTFWGIVSRILGVFTSCSHIARRIAGASKRGQRC